MFNLLKRFFLSNYRLGNYYLLRLPIIFVLLNSYSHAQDTLLPFIDDGKWGALNVQNEIIIPPQFEYLSGYQENLAVAKSNGRYGVLNQVGNWAVSPGYLHLERVRVGEAINDDYAVLKSNRSVSANLFEATTAHGKGVIDPNGEVIIPFLYEGISLANDHVAVGISQRGYSIFLISSGTKILEGLKELNFVGQSFVIAKEGEQKIIYNLSGEQVWKGDFLEVKELDGHLFIDRGRRDKLLLNSQGEEVIKSSKIDEYPSINCVVNQKEGKRGLYSLKRSEWLYTDKVSEITQLATGKFLIRKDGKVGVVDEEGAMRIPIMFDGIRFADNGIYVNNGDSLGLFDYSYQLMVPCEYESIDRNDLAYIPKKDGKYGLYDLRGNQLAEAKYKHFKFKGNIAYGFGNGKVKEFVLPNIDEPTNRIRIKMNMTFGVANRIPDCWFQDSVFYGANKNVVKLKWGLRYNEDSIAISPKYKEIQILPNCNLTKAYVSRLRRDNDLLMQLNYKYSLPIFEFFDVVNHVDREKKERVLFYSLHEDDFKHGKVARARTTKNLVLVNDDGKIIEKMSYAAPFSDGMMRYCYTTKYPKYSEDATDQSFNAWDYWGVNFNFDYFLNAVRYSIVPKFSHVSFPDAKWGYVSDSATVNFPVQFDFAHDFEAGYGVVQTAGKYGLVNRDTITIPLKYKSIHRLSQCADTIFIVKDNVDPITSLVDSLGKPYSSRYLNVKRVADNRIMARTKTGWGELSDQLEWKSKPQFSLVVDAFEDYLVFRSKNKMGISSMDGVIIAEPKYKKVSQFKNECFVVEKNKKFGVVNLAGEEVIPVKHKEVKVLDRGILVGNAMFNYDGEFLIKPRFDRVDVDETNGNLMLSKRGNTIIKNKDQGYKLKLKKVAGITLHDQTVVAYSPSGKGMVLYNLNGVVVSQEYESIHWLKDSVFVTKNKKEYGLITSSGRELLSCSYREVLEVKKGEYAGAGVSALVVNIHNDTLCKGQYIQIEKFSDGYMLCRKDQDSYVYLNDQYQNKFHREFVSGFSFENKLAAVKTKKGWCTINTLGEEVCVPTFHTLEPIAKNVFQAKYYLNRGVMTGSGQEIAPPIFEQVEYLGLELFQVKRNGKVGYVDIRGKWLFNPFEKEIEEHKKRE